MADTNVKITDLPELLIVPDNTITYVVLDGVSYRTTKANLIKSAQNNIKKEIAIPCPVVTELADFAAVINALGTFEISETEIPTFKAISSDLNPVTYYLELLETGKGLYGSGGIELTAANLKITSFVATIEDIETIASTVVVDFGVTLLTVSAVLNLQNPALVIQDQTAGYTIFKITVDSKVKSYLWIGTAGTYGVGNLQSTAADFQVLNDQPQLISNLYVEKEIYSPIPLFSSGIIDTVELDKHSAIKLQGTISELKGIQKNNASYYFIGQPFFLYNDTSGNIKIPHLSGSANIRFFNPETTDYFAVPNEVVIFVLESVSGVLRYKRVTTRLQNKSVTLEKLQDINSQSVFGRISPGIGQPQVLDVFDLLVMLGLQDVVYDLSLKAPKNNPTFTGSVVVPNATLPTQAVNLSQLKLHNVLVDNNIGDVVQHTGTTITTIVKSYVLPAGFFTSDCVFETDLTISKIGAAGNIAIDFGIKPLLVTFPIHLTSATAGNRYINIGRKMTMIKNGLILGFGVSGNGYSDKLANVGAINKASTFDPTISNTFNLTITLGDASDVALLENLTIKVYKNA